MYLGGNGKMRYFFCKLFPNPDCNLLRSSSGIRANSNKDEAFKKASQWLSALSKDRSLDLDGLPMPSYSVAAMHFLEERLKKDMKVFEFGSGLSSLFYARKCKNVTAIEHDPGWYNEVKSHNSSNLSIYLTELETEYDQSILNFEENFDLIIVDGRKRIMYLQLYSKLSRSGVLFWTIPRTNTNRKKIFSRARVQVFENVFTCIFETHIYGNQFFYRTDNCLNI